jgi:DNA-binding transcriptional LysR family regulator
VELREVQPEDALDALLGRRVDICMNLATTELLPGSDDKRVHSEHLLDDVMDVALPFDHPLADRAEIELADLADEDWILANPGVPCWQLSRDACERAGFSPRARHYADEFVGVVGLVAAGHGVSLLPRLAQPEAVHEPIVLRPVAGVSPVRRISVQTRAGTADQPHIAPALESLRRVAAGVARGPLACRSVTRGPAPIADPAPALVS